MGKIIKDLASLLRKTAIISSMAIPLVFASCEEENYPPVAKLEVNPTYGDVPLEVRMKSKSYDLNNNITTYKLHINNEVTNKNTPTDITKTFDAPGTYKVYEEVIDSKGLSDKSDIVSVEVYGKPFLEQSVSLFEDVKIKYTATLSRVDKAELKVNREGVLLLTEEVKDVNASGIDYSKTFSNALNGITKGDYEFILKSENLEKKNSVIVPNYNPTSNIANIKIDLDEESDITTTLPTPLDKNPEDNPVPIKSAKSLDGKTELTLNGYELKIKALPNYIGAYQVEIEYGSTAGGLEKAVLQGQIIEDTRIEINPFIQPNDSTLNWYGSGDVNNDNIVNGQDLTMLNEIIAGTYSNPSDTRLKDRADVNGDEIINSQDRQLLENKLNGSLSYLPGEWNKLKTREEREDWLEKMLAIDLVSEISPFPGWACLQYSDQTYINFHGVASSTDISKFLEVYPYDFSNNGRFNMPLYEAITSDYDSEGNLIGGHAMNTIILGDYALGWNSLCNIEPQFDQINIQPGEAYLIGINSKFYIRGHPPIVYYIQYNIKDKIPTFIRTNPNIKIITQR